MLIHPKLFFPASSYFEVLRVKGEVGTISNRTCCVSSHKYEKHVMERFLPWARAGGAGTGI
jgi:hypothetical protein